MSCALPASSIAAKPPNVLVVTVDTLRADHLSGYGYRRATTPHLDHLLAQGARFTAARTVEPLTAPALSSMLTSLYPHEHGCTRNGLSIRPGLISLPKMLRRLGYRTAAFVGNWTLKDDLSGLSEHFDEYHEIFTRKRWFGLVNSEASAEDLTEAAVDWLEDALDQRQPRPVFVWVHYVEPHAPYLLHPDQASRLGIPQSEGTAPEDRYDTEIAFVDDSIGRLLEAVGELAPGGRTLVVFASDHGESLGDHGYWGHGRHLYEDTLHIPLGVVWPGRIPPQVEDRSALLIDLPRTVLGLLGAPVPQGFHGVDWAPVLLGRTEPPTDRVTFFQAHKGAVRSPSDSVRARRRGLLEVAVLEGTSKEVFRLKSGGRRQVFDLVGDPEELTSEVQKDSDPSSRIAAWLKEVEAGLVASDADLEAPLLDKDAREHLKALGYLD